MCRAVCTPKEDPGEGPHLSPLTDLEDLLEQEVDKAAL